MSTTWGTPLADRALMRSLFRIMSVACFSLVGFACGGAAVDTTPTNDAGPTGAPASDAAPPSVDAGPAIVIPKDATLIFRSRGGLSANARDTSVCTIVDETYSFDVATGAFTWKVCAMNDAGTKNDFTTGDKKLSASYAAPLQKALAAVRVVQVTTPCGGDLPTETLEVSTPSELTPQVFYQPSDQCADKNLTHVSGLDDVHSELIKLAQ